MITINQSEFVLMVRPVMILKEVGGQIVYYMLYDWFRLELGFDYGGGFKRVSWLQQVGYQLTSEYIYEGPQDLGCRFRYSFWYDNKNFKFVCVK